MFYYKYPIEHDHFHEFGNEVSKDQVRNLVGG